MHQTQTSRYTKYSTKFFFCHTIFLFRSWFDIAVAAAAVCYYLKVEMCDVHKLILSLSLIFTRKKVSKEAKIMAIDRERPGKRHVNIVTEWERKQNNLKTHQQQQKYRKAFSCRCCCYYCWMWMIPMNEVFASERALLCAQALSLMLDIEFCELRKLSVSNCKTLNPQKKKKKIFCHLLRAYQINRVSVSLSSSIQNSDSSRSI